MRQGIGAPRFRGLVFVAVAVSTLAGRSASAGSGACCLADNCVQSTQAQCAAVGGQYIGHGSSCTAVLCFGACCLLEGECFDGTVGACLAAEGIFQGIGKECATSSCFGACCLPDGFCFDTTELICVSTLGDFVSTSITCADVVCDEPPGACCFGDGGCTELLEVDCEALSGVFLGEFLYCNNVPCNGACCLPDGECANAELVPCQAQGGTFFGVGTACGAATCPAACCLPDGSCIVGTLQTCVSAAGTYQGFGSVCEQIACPLPAGACCAAAGGCTVADELTCISAGGAYQGDDSACRVGTCPQPTGACCYEDATCDLLEAEACVAAGGAFQGAGITCALAHCPQPTGACCLPDGSCELLDEDECTGQSGEFEGIFTACAAGLCPQPIGACCFPDATCLQRLQDECETAGATWHGPLTSCLDVECVLLVGACCQFDTSCDVLAADDCHDSGGAYEGDGTLCAEVTCELDLDSFTEEAAARGVNFMIQPAVPQTFGRGVGLIDLDGDGDADLVALGGVNGVIGIFENNGSGSFINRSLGSGITPTPQASGISAADYDADGDMDLYLSNWLVPDALLRNNGNFNFTNVSLTAGIVTELGAGAGCAWGDYDGDGWLDLYVANRTGTASSDVPNRLYRNLGDGTFVDVAEPLGVDDGEALTFQAVFFDYDRDADADLYLSTDKGYSQFFNMQNRLFRNDGGAFTDVTEISGTAANIDSMGVAVGDFDGNRYMDIYCTNTPLGNLLYMNYGVFPFPEQAVDVGVASFALGWGTAFIDYNNNGFLELYVCNEAPNRLYGHNGTLQCADLGPVLAIDDHVDSFGLAVADVDLDGDIDLLVQDADRLRLYMNHEGHKRRSVRFAVAGPPPNRHAVGARVDVRVGAEWQVREVSLGGSYKSQHERYLHFGVDQARTIDELRVVWPGGLSRTLTDLPTDQSWTLYHPQLIFDADSDGDRDLVDFLALMACIEAGGFQPGCEIMDGSGNSSVGIDDYTIFLSMYDGPVEDCNDNGTPDLTDIVLGASDDDDGDGIPDECGAPPGDSNGDGVVDVDDLLATIVNWGACGPGACTGDFDGDEVVDVDDLLTVILHWTSSS